MRVFLVLVVPWGHFCPCGPFGAYGSLLEMFPICRGFAYVRTYGAFPICLGSGDVDFLDHHVFVLDVDGVLHSGFLPDFE